MHWTPTRVAWAQWRTLRSLQWPWRIFFLWSTLRWLWTLGHWCCTSRRTSPRKPVRVSDAEDNREQAAWEKVKAERDEARRDASPLGGRQGQQWVTRTPEKRLSSKALIESPEARAAQGHLLEAMVQRAHPVVQDLHDMHRLGGVGPGTMLRRGSRLQ